MDEAELGRVAAEHLKNDSFLNKGMNILLSTVRDQPIDALHKYLSDAVEAFKDEYNKTTLASAVTTEAAALILATVAITMSNDDADLERVVTSYIVLRAYAIINQHKAASSVASMEPEGNA